MFNSAKNKIFTYILAFLFLASFAFGCALAMPTVFGVEDNHHGQTAGCCGTSALSITGYDTHNQSYILNDNVWALLTILLGIVFLANSSLLYFCNSRLTYYHKIIRDRYGGFRLFNKFTLLFSQGIIHPKVF